MEETTFAKGVVPIVSVRVQRRRRPDYERAKASSGPRS